MAQQSVKGTIGDQPVELNNAATETTLAALLVLAKKDSATLTAMAIKAGVDAEAIKKAAQSMQASAAQNQRGGGGSELGETAKSASLLGGFLLDMGASVMKTAANLGALTGELIEGKARASDLFKAFKDLPLGLGALAGLFQFVMKQQESMYDAYKSISSSGAGLNGELIGLRKQASGLYLTLDELVGMYKKSGDVLTQLGGSATSGSAALLAINQTMKNSGLNSELLNLGYSFVDVNDMLGKYLRVSGDGMRAGKNVEKEHSRLASAAATYGKELDFMARLTGESREALEAKMQAEAAEASWQAHLNSLEPAQREKANMALIKANAIGGKGAMDTLKASIMGFAAPFSEEGRNYVATMQGGTKAIEGLKDVVLDGSSATASKGKMDKLMAAGLAANIRDMKGFGNIVAAMGQGGAEGAKGLMELQAIVNKYNSTGKVSQEQLEAEIKAVVEKQELDAKNAKAAVDNEKRMKELSAKINEALQPALEKLTTVANDLVKRFSDFVTDKGVLARVQEGLDKLADFIKLTFSDPEKAWAKIAGFFQELLAKFFKYFAQSKLGNYLFGDLAGEYERDAKVNEMRGMDQAKMLALIQKEKDGTLNKETEAPELAKMRDIMREGRQALGNQFVARAKEIEKQDTLLEAKKRYGKKYNKTDEEVDHDYNWSLSGLQEIGKSMDEIQKEYKAQAEEVRRQGKDIATGKEGRIDIKPKYNNGTVGTGALIQDFKGGTDVELHGKEAVLTEAQLTAMVKNIQSSAAANGGANVQNALANALMALNSQQAMTNQLLVQSVDMQRKIAESQPSWMGNRFARVA